MKHFTKQKKIEFNRNDSRVNHMNARNNRNMYNLILDIINNNAFAPKEIKMEEYFEILK
jgi:hypothetical protein